MNRHQLIEGYKALGGIPYYWSLLDKSMSLALNIDRLFFSKDGELKGEYNELYASLFNHPEKYLLVIETLGRKRLGLNREEIIKEGKLESNGKLSEILEDLENCGFIRKYNMIGMKSKGALYQLTDCYTLFYFRFIHDNPANDEHFWSKSIGTGEYNNSCGLAFERVCLLHSRQIKAKLGISGIISSEYAWSAEREEGKRGAQIDLLIDRNDGVINLCEMKYSKSPFRIDANFEANLLNKRTRFIDATHTKKAVHLTMVCSQGLERNSYADEIQSLVTGGDLFAE
jgi:hypothetical protein